MKTAVILSLIPLLLASCSKEEFNPVTEQDNFMDYKADPVIEAYSPFGETVIAPDNYIPNLSSCSNYSAIYLHYPTNGPWAGKTVEIYRYDDEGSISGPCGDEFDLTKQTGTNESGEYNYCEAPAKDCYEGTVNGHCALVFCDN
jgi:hypothetical protein